MCCVKSEAYKVHCSRWTSVTAIALASFLAGVLMLDVGSGPLHLNAGASVQWTASKLRSRSADELFHAQSGIVGNTGDQAGEDGAAAATTATATANHVKTAASSGDDGDGQASGEKAPAAADRDNAAGGATERSAQGQQHAQQRTTLNVSTGSWHYRGWAADHIRHDFRHWMESGIQQQQVEELVTSGRYKWGSNIDAFRFQIVSGELYVDTSDIVPPERGQIKWFPHTAGPGNMAKNGRAPLAMLALLELLRQYPGQVPDVDALLIFADMPVVALKHNPTAAPLFQACSNDDFAEVPFPDWTYWSGTGGWEAQREKLLAAGQAAPLAGRHPALMYRGRALEKMPGDAKRAAVVACRTRLPQRHRSLVNASSVVWTSKENAVSAATQCRWRYLIYIESYGWSASLKSRLACGAVLLQVKTVWVEWFSRGLQGGKHFVEVAAAPVEAVCPDLLSTLLAFERAFGGKGSKRKAAKEGVRVAAADGSRKGAAATTVVAKALAPPADPVAMGAAQLDFVRDKLAMKDVREYMLDALGTYAALQRFQPRPSASAVKLTAPELLQHFLFDQDRATILELHPWLADGR